MNRGLLALLAGSLDYAGVFPPASLAVEEAVKNYNGYRAGPDAWFLGRFVCRPTQLKDAITAARGDLKRVSLVIGRAAGTNGFLEQLAAELAPVRELTGGAESTGGTIEAVETALSAELLASASSAGVSEFCTQISSRLQQTQLKPALVFHELPLENGAQPLAPVLEGLKTHNGALTDARWTAGNIAAAKFRLGGGEPMAGAMLDQVAGVIEACSAAGVPWKATAGLHQPLGRFEAGGESFHFGFLSLIVAGVLSQSLRLGAAILRDVLAETDPAAFRIDDKGVAWRDHCVPAGAVCLARDRGPQGIGSCSFDEPLAGLRALGFTTDNTDATDKP